MCKKNFLSVLLALAVMLTVAACNAGIVFSGAMAEKPRWAEINGPLRLANCLIGIRLSGELLRA